MAGTYVRIPIAEFRFAGGNDKKEPAARFYWEGSGGGGAGENWFLSRIRKGEERIRRDCGNPQQVRTRGIGTRSERCSHNVRYVYFGLRKRPEI